MPVTSVHKDPESLTLTFVAEFPVPQERLWDAYADPRQLERFWGPPLWPATFTRHDMVVGGRSEYAMVGPEGDSSHGYWEFLEVRPPHSFEALNGFCHPDGSVNAELPTLRMAFLFEATDGGSRVTATSYFGSVADMELLLQMGMEEGSRLAMGQIDHVLGVL